MRHLILQDRGVTGMQLKWLDVAEYREDVCGAYFLLHMAVLMSNLAGVGYHHFPDGRLISGPLDQIITLAICLQLGDLDVAVKNLLEKFKIARRSSFTLFLAYEGLYLMISAFFVFLTQQLFASFNIGLYFERKSRFLIYERIYMMLLASILVGITPWILPMVEFAATIILKGFKLIQIHPRVTFWIILFFKVGMVSDAFDIGIQI